MDSLKIGIDFDGTCVTHEYPKIGIDIGAQNVLQKLVTKGHKLILNTMRSDKPLRDAVEWFAKNDIPLYSVAFDPDQRRWTNSTKCYAHCYIDDAALGCPLIFNPNLCDNPFVDWILVEALLITKGIL
jgi:hypothetical protein